MQMMTGRTSGVVQRWRSIALASVSALLLFAFIGGANAWANIAGIAIDAAGNVYTTDRATDTVSKFALGGTAYVGWATTGDQPSAIAIDAAGNLYTTNRGSGDVSKITPEGVSTVDWAPLEAVTSWSGMNQTRSPSMRTATSMS